MFAVISTIRHANSEQALFETSYVIRSHGDPNSDLLVSSGGTSRDEALGNVLSRVLNDHLRELPCGRGRSGKDECGVGEGEDGEEEELTGSLAEHDEDEYGDLWRIV